jgi:hypothetical protein
VLGVVALSLLILFPVASATTSNPTPPTFTSPNPSLGGGFGVSVAVSRSTVVVGAGGEPGGGHAYIFSTTTPGSQPTILTSPNQQLNGGFGSSVAVNFSIVVVGAPSESAGGFGGAGHAYIFSTLSPGSITLTSDNPQPHGFFGSSVAVSGTSVVIGAPGEGFGFGHAYIFRVTAPNSPVTLPSPNPQIGGEFGDSVAVSGTSVVVGAPGETAGGSSGAGHAYIFSTTTPGSPPTLLTSPNAQPLGEFGSSVAVSGTSVVVGAPDETAGAVVIPGHAYIFSTTTPGSPVTLTSPNPQKEGSFGRSVAVSGTSVVVGAPGETAAGVSSAGHAYLFSTLRTTSTTVSCNLPSVAVNQPTQCTAIVTDTSPGTPISPGGTVSFSSSSSGSFTPPNPCTLSPTTSSTSSCSVSYTPNLGSEGTHVITGTYSGDSTHSVSSGTFNLDVKQRTTSTSVSCPVSTLTDHHSTPCTATVTDTSPGTLITPSGTVAWKSSSKVGTFSPVPGNTNPCTLSGVPGSGTATCTVTYTASPGTPLSQTITGTYSGDTDHSGSSGTTPITTP